MKVLKKTYLILVAIAVCFLFVANASADVVTNVWVDCSINQIQTGVIDGEDDTRMNLNALDASFTDTWLVVDSTAAKMVAATVLTAYSLERNIRIHIVPYGSGYRVDAVRVLP